MTTSLNPLEEILAEGFLSVVGDPLFLGLILLGFFGALVFVQGTRLDGKLVVIVPVLLMSLLFLPPWLAIAFAIGMGVVVYLALTKFTRG